MQHTRVRGTKDVSGHNGSASTHQTISLLPITSAQPVPAITHQNLFRAVVTAHDVLSVAECQTEDR